MNDDQETNGPDSISADAQGDAELLMSTWDDGEAAMIRQILETNGIPAQVVSQVPHSVWPITVDGLGEVRILVSSSRIEEARALIAEHRRDGLAAAAADEDENEDEP